MTSKKKNKKIFKTISIKDQREYDKRPAANLSIFQQFGVRTNNTQ